MIDEDFRTKLKSYADAFNVPVEKDKVSEEQPRFRVEFERAESNPETFTNGAALAGESIFDVEVAGQAPDKAMVQNLADAIKAGLNGFSGTVGGTVFLGAWVSDHSDDYEPHLLDYDDGTFTASFRVQVIEG